MKRIFKNKRGMAMESAILFMLVILMLGLLLTGVIMHTHLRVKLNNTQLSREITIEQIGENFVNLDKTAFETSLAEYTDYTATTAYNENEKNTLTLTRGKSVVLYIEVRTADKAVLCWQYSVPKVTE